MADPVKSIPASLDLSGALREVFLAHFTDPTDNLALRRVADLVYQFTLEWQHFPDTGEPVISVDLRATAKDLRYLETFLAETVASSGGVGDPRRERALAVRADEWAEKIAAIASEIEASIVESPG